MKTKLLIIVTAVFFGIATGYLGSAIEHYNQSRFGTSYSQWRCEWLGLPGLPGFLLAQHQTGYDWQAGENWIHRHSVAAWNVAFWLAASIIGTAPFIFCSFARRLLRNR